MVRFLARQLQHAWVFPERIQQLEPHPLDQVLEIRYLRDRKLLHLRHQF